MLFCFDRHSRAALSGALVATTLALAAAGPAAAAATSTLDMLGVTVTNSSEPILCAEKDNVTLSFSSPEVTQFRIEAAHPSYIGALAKDSYAADWTACDFGGPTGGPYKQPERVTIHEDIELWIVAHRNGHFWRDAGTKVRIGDKVFEGIQLLQVWMISHMGGEEMLVLYPQDGYWRMRPKAPAGREPTVFGTSFLVGPTVIDGGRPVVDISEISFDPKSRMFTLAFKAGGKATVAMSKADRDRQVLDVTFDKAISGAPFAVMRSMYITRFNNDVADIAVLEKGAKSWREEPIMSFSGAERATEVWAGRVAPSRHNTSSPDMVFSAFSDGSKSPPEWRGPVAPRGAAGAAASPAQK
ncbi:MAG: hypothetical protein KDJ37_12210 [Hyphomicrobiaceae bacterium]|nr:hypothetical protein [Hyphomicrobiaceae bacterium]